MGLPSSQQPTTNHKYLYLDGIRGIAALLVLVRHTGKFWHFAFHRTYLAVDLFFVLSGFVIAHAYDERLRTGEYGVSKFLKVRVIRLYPIYLLSVLIATFVAIMVENRLTYVQIIESSLLTAFYLPTVLGASNELFPLNSVYWSLLFELIVNLIYVYIVRTLSTRVLVGIASASAIGLGVVCAKCGSLNLGFTWEGTSFAAGLARAIFGFFSGLLLFRIRRQHTALLSSSCRPALASTLICLALVFPKTHSWDGVVDWTIAVIVFPSMILFASNSTRPIFSPLLEKLGASSYPVYVLHKPLGEITAYIVGKPVGRFAPFSGVLFVCGLVALSLWLVRYFDTPLRRWLTSRLVQTPHRAAKSS